MRTIVIIISLAVFLPFSIMGQGTETPPVIAQKISDNLYQLTGGRGANSGMYIGDNDVLIIDSKMDETSVQGILKAVKTVTEKPVKWLINTHSDGDHINGNEFFPQDVVIVSHENCRKEFFYPNRNGAPSRWLDEKLLPFIPEIIFNDRMQLHMGRKSVELYYLGVGHTTGDIVVYFPEEKTAFIGDQVFFGRPQLIHSYKGGSFFGHIKTTEKILETVDAERFCSGHADIKTRADIKQHLEEMNALQLKIRALVKEGRSLEEVQKSFDSDHRALAEVIYTEIKNGF
jgi:cyclase